MRFRKLNLVVVSAAAAVVALAVTLYVRGGLIDALLMILIGAGLVGMYLLRRYARAHLLYNRHAASNRSTARLRPVGVTPPGRAVPASSTGTAPPAGPKRSASQPGRWRPLDAVPGAVAHSNGQGPDRPR
jgi:hypothetical protein